LDFNTQEYVGLCLCRGPKPGHFAISDVLDLKFVGGCDA